MSLENALIDKQHHIKLIDFGLSKKCFTATNANANANTNANANANNCNANGNGNGNVNVSFKFRSGQRRIGKVRCMCPEIYDLQAFDGRFADCWSIGIMLFMMTLGIPPFNMPSETETIFRMIQCGRIRDVIIYNRKMNMISEECLDLLIRFFKQQNERIALNQVLQHPFCRI